MLRSVKYWGIIVTPVASSFSFVDVVYVFFIPVREMDDFYVFGSNQGFPSSPFGAIMDGAYQLCGQYPGTPPVGEVSRVTCEPHPITARYVFIQIDRQETPAVVELCEVWVYGSKCL